MITALLAWGFALVGSAFFWWGVNLHQKSTIITEKQEGMLAAFLGFIFTMMGFVLTFVPPVCM